MVRFGTLPSTQCQKEHTDACRYCMFLRAVCGTGRLLTCLLTLVPCICWPACEVRLFAYVLHVANLRRLYDPAVILNCMMPWLHEGNQVRKFGASSLRALTRKILTYNTEASQVQFGTAAKYQVFEGLQSNPAGCAGAHSGHTFLGALQDSSHDLPLCQGCENVTHRLGVLKPLH